jgi:hypothetical protein
VTSLFRFLYAARLRLILYAGGKGNSSATLWRHIRDGDKEAAEKLSAYFADS